MSPNGTGQGEQYDPSAWSRIRKLEQRVEKLERELERLQGIIDRMKARDASAPGS